MRMKKLLCLGLAAAIACTSLPPMGVQAQEGQERQQEEGRKAAAANEEGGGDFLIEDGFLYEYTGDGGDVVIPDGVIEIFEGAFRNCETLRKVTIPEGVTATWPSAFAGCKNLVSVTLPESLKAVSDYTFANCSSLESITIPKNVEAIGYRAFRGCSALNSITVDNSNPTYDSRDNCNAIIDTKDNALLVGCCSSTIPPGVARIGYDAFGDCAGLKKITIPDSVTHIEQNAFSGCSGLEIVSVDDGNPTYDSRDNCNAVIQTDENQLIIGCKNTNIPESVTSIGCEAFNGRSSLAEITIPDWIEYIDYGAFSGCSGLEIISVDDGNPTYDSRDNCNAVIQTDENQLIIGCKNTRIPNGVTGIGSHAFDGCSGLTSITIPSGVTAIADGAFSGCSGLTGITIPSGVTDIAASVFSGCSGLTSITIPSGVTAIADGAFYGCSGLTEIIIPENVVEIGAAAFSACHKDFTMLVYAGSYAETYAKENSIPYRYVGEGGDAHTHSYQSQITTQPTCTTAGVKTFTCSCGDSYTETIAAAGHKYTKTTKNPTCTAKGTVTYTCSVCQHSYKEEIAATGHKYKKTTTKATCTAKGAIICTCTVCRHRYTEKTLPAAGHKYVTTKAAATMKKNGMITTTCKACKRKTQTVIYAPRTVALSKTEAVYNGKQQKLKVTVKDSKGRNLKKGRDYTVTYQKDMKKVGKHTVTVKFKGNYYGTVKMYLSINPKKTSLSKATPTEKGFDLKWKKQAKEISGYEIAYSTSKKFSPKSTKTLTAGKGKTSKSITGLKAKKKYYVRIRTYKKVKGKKYYSEWSKAKGVTTKKAKGKK